jgi:putative chitinase
MMTGNLLIKIAPDSTKVASIVSDWFNKYACQYEITTPKRVAAFMAQTIEESACFRKTREDASGSAYEGRADLGNVFPGDGKRYKGRGYIQITGRNNYRAVSKALFGDETLLTNPELLTTPQYAMLSGLWFWKDRDLNSLADKQWFQTITQRINGGLNGFATRIHFYNIFCKEFGLKQYDIETRDITDKDLVGNI